MTIALIEHAAPMPAIRSARAAEVAQLFGLDRRPAARALVPARGEATLPLPELREILLVTGASGSGKSSLLRVMREQIVRARGRCIELARLRLPDRPLVDCFGSLPVLATLQTLSRVGLAEAQTYLRTPGELSDGQRDRLRLALGVHRATRLARSARHCPVYLIADEFTSLLDRVTAAVVACALRRMVTAEGHIAAIVATAHEDIVPALRPDHHMACDFGRCEVRRSY